MVTPTAALMFTPAAQAAMLPSGVPFGPVAVTTLSVGPTLLAGSVAGLVLVCALAVRQWRRRIRPGARRAPIVAAMHAAA